LVISAFSPVSDQPPSTFRARQRMAAASVPASGSVRPKQPMCSPRRPGLAASAAFWACVPKRAIGPPHRPTLAPADKNVLAQALARASSAIARISQSPGAPPHSASWYRPKKPMSARSDHVSGGSWPAWSTVGGAGRDALLAEALEGGGELAVGFGDREVHGSPQKTRSG
jgi:hypothetical protein